MKRTIIAAALMMAASVHTCAAAFEHCIYDAVPLNGAWEMAYRSNSWDSVEYPQFKGVEIKNAVPGFWEDMIPDFRTAGMKDSFWMNPQYAPERFPRVHRAHDMTIPGIFGCFFYRRTVHLDEVRTAVLAFEGVRNQVHLWVNGKFAASRQGFSTPFELTIPDGLLRKGDNEIVLAVANRSNDSYNGGRVKSGISIRSIYACTGGIDGKVELRFPKNTISDVYVTTAKDLKSFTVYVGGTGNGDRFVWEILDEGKVIAKGEAAGDFTLATDGFSLWSPENPVRYTLRITTPEGSYTQKFGIRRLVADGERLRLNGEFIFLRGVTEICYFPKTVHIPRDIEYYRMMMRKRKELGFNFVRLHTFIPPAEYLEAADELGLLVHVESPNFVTRAEFKSIIAFARKHPSVVIYCTGNETRVDDAAEKYLRDVARLVHRETDSLFAPISSLFGVECFFRKNQRGVKKDPFPHDPVRLSRLAEFTDIFMSYQLGATSYDALNKATAEEVDSWGDPYCGRPRSSHEICINGTFADLSLEKDYPPDSPLLASGFLSGIRSQLERKGLLDRAQTYADNSSEWARRLRKFTFEKVRSMKRMAGYDFLGDLNGHWHTYGYFVGMMDEFFRLKHGETVENVLRYNSAAVLLTDLGSDFNVRAGEKKRVAFSVSNFAGDAKDAVVRVSVVACRGGDCVWSVEKKVGDVKNGDVAEIGEFEVVFPAADVPRKYLLRASFEGGVVKAENEWEMYAFPTGGGCASRGCNGRDARCPSVVIASDISRDDLLAAMARGERVLLFGAGPFNSLPTSYQIIVAGRSLGRSSATVVKAGHPALEGLPHEGFCGWQFRRLMEDGRAVQLEAGIPFDPIIDVVSSDKCIVRQSSLFEYRVGEGRLLVCSFNFVDGDPAAAWFKRRLEEYAASDQFAPALSLTPAQLRAVIDAPLISDKPVKNEVVNPNDPAGHGRSAPSAAPAQTLSEGCPESDRAISLAGRWDFALGDATNCTDTITLPSTTDIARKGDGRIDGKDVEEIAPERDDAAITSKFTRHPTRRFPYVGKATYERDINIPGTWAGRRIELFLERTKFVDVILDGKHIGRCETLAAPATVEFPRDIATGRHRLRLVVDNSLKGRPLSGHQISDDTQTNWNGVMGRMELRSFGTISMPQVKVFPDADGNKVTAKVVFRNDGAGEAKVDVGVEVSPQGQQAYDSKMVGRVVPNAPSCLAFPYMAPCGVSTGEFVVVLGPDAPKWSEFNPALHTLTVNAGGASETVRFGLRDFRAKGTQFTLNGRPVFLRGRHDACVWPLTGAAPMEVEPWRKYFATLKEYGLNHVRFHSWCPPDAAFEAADEAGFFLQPEFAAFGGSFAKDSKLRSYCLAESKRIIDAYGNHPSFVMFTLGNECRGGRKERSEIVRALRTHDPRPLYAIATNGDFMNPEQCEEDDFWATFRSCDGSEGNVRGSYAHCNAPLGAVQLPGGGTMRDFSSAVRHSTIPLIGHETGQFQAYPDYSEIPKYTGVLKPINLEIFKTRLEKAGLGTYAADFCRASGRLMAINYREEMEEAFRTPGFGGFQLLDIQDFPGQGTALVGILNAFMESKGFITPERWRMSCSPTVLLARFPRYTYVSGEKFVAEVQIAHYGKEDVLQGDLEWSIEPATGRIGVSSVRVGEVKSVGRIEMVLPRLKKAERLELRLSFADGKVQNSYPLWVYPECGDVVPDGVEIVRDLESADKALAEGRTALCILDKAKAPTNSVPGFFASDFWNWEMFNGPARKRKVIAPGTLGLLVKREHPALAGFPTSFHSDYQWRELIFNGVNVVLDGDKDVDVIVRGIDNITRNQNLGVIWEKRRGKGRVLCCSLDLEAAKELPEARALRRSLLDYLALNLKTAEP